MKSKKLRQHKLCFFFFFGYHVSRSNHLSSKPSSMESTLCTYGCLRILKSQVDKTNAVPVLATEIPSQSETSLLFSRVRKLQDPKAHSLVNIDMIQISEFGAFFFNIFFYILVKIIFSLPNRYKCKEELA